MAAYSNCNDFILQSNSNPSWTQLHIINTPQNMLLLGKPEWLCYSNKPESVASSGMLYQKEGLHGNSRIFFFHKNISGGDGKITVEIVADNSSKMALTGGVCMSHESEMHAGQIMGVRWFESRHQGILFKKQWKRSYPLLSGQVGGGILDIFPQDSSSIYSIHVSFSNASDLKATQSFNASTTCYKYNEFEKSFWIHTPEKRNNLLIGQNDFLTGPETKLYGNYGVNHRYLIHFKDKGRYTMYFTANGGPARFVADFDGKLLQAYSAGDMRLFSFIIAKPSIKVLETMPLGGSNYPITLTIMKVK